MNDFMRGEKVVPLLYNILYEWMGDLSSTNSSWFSCLIDVDENQLLRISCHFEVSSQSI
jgi:hypothetical protein